MKQIFVKSAYNAGFASGTSWIPASAGIGDFGTTVSFGADYATHPTPIAGTFRNLIVYSRSGVKADLTLTLLVNGVASALSTPLAAASTSASNTTDSVTVAAEDDITFRVTTTLGVGHDLSFSVEFEGAQNIYGITPWAGSFGATGVVSGGALGNGLLAAYAGGGRTGSYSICAVAGTLTKITLKSYAGAPGVGVWTANAMVNGIQQDGTAGSVDTRTVLTGASTIVSQAFVLPISITDHVEIVLTRTVIDAPFAVAQVGIGVAFTPTTDGEFMFCGGSNDTISTTDIGWVWNKSEQLANAETRVLAPTGSFGYTAKGLFAEVESGPTPGRSFTYTVRKNEASTGLAVTIADNDITGSMLLDVPFVLNDTVALMITPTALPASHQFHWGLAVSTAVAAPVVVTPPMGCVLTRYTGEGSTGSGCTVPNHSDSI